MSRQPHLRQQPAQLPPFEIALAEGQSIGASEREVRQIYEVVERQPLPEDVKSVEVRFGRDWTGDPAAWIWFQVDDDLDPSKEKIRRLRKFADAVRDRLLEANDKYWPYIGYNTIDDTKS